MVLTLIPVSVWLALPEDTVKLVSSAYCTIMFLHNLLSQLSFLFIHVYRTKVSQYATKQYMIIVLSEI